MRLTSAPRAAVVFASLAAAGAAVSLNAPARAQSPAATIPGTPALFAESASYSHGFRFTPLVNVVVASLGYFDAGGDGLAQSHQVAIWNDATNVLLTSTIIPAGTGPTLLSGFRYVPVSSLTLLAGQTYVASGRATGSINDLLAAQVPGTVNFDSRLSIVSPSGVFTGGTGFAKPTNNFVGYNAYLGPNFLIGGASSAAPEPGSAALALVGMAFLFTRNRRFRKEK